MRAAFAIVIASLFACVFPPVDADSANVMAPTFPTYWTSAVWTGQHAYVFGGATNSGDSAAIRRYDPSTDTLAVMGAALPEGKAATAAVWDGQYAYVFGGAVGPWDRDKIVRYDPASDTVVTVGAVLPTPRSYMSAVWTGQYAYLFGGWQNGVGGYSQILRYDPASDSIAPMSAVLPAPRMMTSAVWDSASGHAYIFGGGDTVSSSAQILRYHPASDTLAVVGNLPTTRGRTSATWDGTHAYVFGGISWIGSLINYDDVVRYTPSSSDVAVMSASLPMGRWATSAIWTGAASFVFGGCGDNNCPSNQIVRHTLEPGAPASLAATPGPGGGEVTLTWQAPPSTTYSSGLTYEVHRAPSGTGPFSLVQNVGNQVAFTDTGRGNGATWHYKVRAVSAAGPGPFSAVAAATTFLPPGAPQSFAAAAGPGPAEVTLSWQPPASSGGSAITSYRVYRGSTAGDLALVATGGCSGLSDVLSCTDTARGDAATWFYSVSAVNVAGEGAHSDTANATTFAQPSAPQGLQAAAGPTPGDITLAWNPPTTDGGTAVTHHRIFRSETTGGPYAQVIEIGDVDTWTDTGREAGVTYYYVVQAVNAVGAGPASNEAAATGTQPLDSDGDDDLIPDVLEAPACANENPNLLADGHCSGSNYVPPTAEDVLSDLIWLLTGSRP